MSKILAAITCVGGYVPEDKLTNIDLEKLVDTNDEWITTRTGIKERRILKGEGLGTSDMAVKAVQQIFDKKGIDPLEIELLICATTTPDFTFPATANVITDKLGMKNARMAFKNKARIIRFMIGYFRLFRFQRYLNIFTINDS